MTGQLDMANRYQKSDVLMSGVCFLLIDIRNLRFLMSKVV